MFIKRNRDDVIFMMLPESAEVAKDDKYTYFGEQKILNSYLESSGTLIEGVAVPEDFEPEKYKYVDSQFVVNPNYVTPEERQQQIEEQRKRRELKLLEIEAERAGFETVEDYLAEQARKKRDHLIRETDWRALQDVTLPQAWADYRQALRDVPQQEGFPTDVTWPEKPQ